MSGKTEKKLMTKRILMCVFGVLICGMNVGLFKLAAFGVDPFQSFMAGLDSLVPISFGTLYVIANVVLLFFSLIFERHYIGLGTFVNLFLLGYVVQFSYWALQKMFPDPSFIFRVGCIVVGIIVISLSVSLYMTADLGVSTYDAVALVIVNKWKIGKFKYVRVITDLCCVATGVILFLASGGSVSKIPTIAGVGTIITAFFMGPIIEFFNVHVSRPLLKEK